MIDSLFRLVILVVVCLNLCIILSTVGFNLIYASGSGSISYIQFNTTYSQSSGSVEDQKNVHFVPYMNLTWHLALLHPDSAPPQGGYCESDWNNIQKNQYCYIANFCFEPNVGVLLIVGRIDDYPLDQYMQDHVDSYRGPGPIQREAFELLDSRTDYNLSNNRAYKIEFTDIEGSKLNCNDIEDKTALRFLDVGTIINVPGGQMIYFMQYFAPPELYYKYLGLAEEMIKSLKLGDISNRAEATATIFRVYNNLTQGVKGIQYPSEWEISYNPDLGFVQFKSPYESSYQPNVVIGKADADPSVELEHAVAERVQSFVNNFKWKTFTLLNSDYDLDLVGLPAYSIFYSYLNPQGGNDIILSQEIGTEIEDQIYRIIFSASVSDFHIFKDIFQNMKDSLVLQVPTLASTSQDIKKTGPEI